MRHLPESGFGLHVHDLFLQALLAGNRQWDVGHFHLYLWHHRPRDLILHFSIVWVNGPTRSRRPASFFLPRRSRRYLADPQEFQDHGRIEPTFLSFAEEDLQRFTVRESTDIDAITRKLQDEAGGWSCPRWRGQTGRFLQFSNS